MGKCLIIFLLLLTFNEGIAQKQRASLVINFGSNKFELTKKHKTALNIFLDTLVLQNWNSLYIVGHTDSDADTSYNQALSVKRSLSVKNYFVERGIDSSLILIQAYGDIQPLVANTSPIGKAKNRRVEVFVFIEDESAIMEALPIGVGYSLTCQLGDTTVALKSGYMLTMSQCDWVKNKDCMAIHRSVRYKYKTNENWLKKHLGFRRYVKYYDVEPYYEFAIVGCTDSCYQKPVTVYIPQAQIKNINLDKVYPLPGNQKEREKRMLFKKQKINNVLYYKTEVYCPISFYCGTDNRCSHDIRLKAKKGINILSYSYYINTKLFGFDSIATQEVNTNGLIENYRNSYFETFVLQNGKDTVRLKNIPIDLFSHGYFKLKEAKFKKERRYFLFFPYKIRPKCGHYKKYKIRPKDLIRLQKLSAELSPAM